MRTEIEKRLKTGKIFKYSLIAVAAVVIVLMIAQQIAVAAILIMGVLVLWLVYLNRYYVLASNQKWLEKRNFSHLPDTMQDSDMIYPASKVRCGKFAMMTTNTYLFVPYVEIAWIYVHVTKAYGLITTSKQVMFMCRDGRSFGIPVNEEELKMILANHILPVNSRIMVGFAPEKQKAYRELVKEFKANH